MTNHADARAQTGDETDDDEWACAKPGCDLGVDGHDLALVLEHTLYDEPNFTAEDAQEVADRTLDKVARAFSLGEPEAAR